MRKLLCLAVVLGLSGCATPQSSRSPNSLGDVFKDETDLDVCYTVQSYGNDVKWFSVFLEGKLDKLRSRSKGFFRSMVQRQSLKETKGCDVMFSYTNTSNTVFSPDVCDAYSAYTGRRLFHEEKRGSGQVENLLSAFVEQFKAGTSNYNQIVSERQTLGRIEPPQPVAQPETPASSLSPATASDVDAPRYSVPELECAPFSGQFEAIFV